MKLLENAKISTKILALLLMLGIITAFIAWNGSRALMKADVEYSDLMSDTLNNTNVANVRGFSTAILYNAYQTMAYDGNSTQARAAQASEKQAYESALQALAAAKKRQPELGGQADQLQRKVQELQQIALQAVQYGMRNQNADAMRVLTRADEISQDLNRSVTSLIDAGMAESDKRNDAQTVIDIAASNSMLIISGVGVLLGLIVAFFASRSGITAPLGRLQVQMGEIASGDFAKDVEGVDRGDEVGAMARAVRVFRENGIAKQAADQAKARADAEQKMVVDTVSTHLSDLSGGDLTATITTDFPGEYVALKTNFNEALDKLRTLIGAVSESAATIRTGSGEIAQASEDLARRTESNAASLEETAASVTQMDGRLKASAQAATKTVERADQAIATVGSGRAVADDAMQAMNRVSDSAKGIDSVIEGLDKIAFQTRVLAMNAAVEAGRAGDAGRGFAVVADLVSALAMRAEEEAKRARDQLTVTQTDIVTAVEAVHKVDTALGNISGDVGQVHELLATMAADNQAQSAAITQISSAIGTMDQATQQNAAMVEQTSAAARSLASEVGGLSEQASRFNIGKGVSPPSKSATTSTKSRKVDARSYASPVKPLPAAGIAALVRAEEDWNAF